MRSAKWESKAGNEKDEAAATTKRIRRAGETQKAGIIAGPFVSTFVSTFVPPPAARSVSDELHLHRPRDHTLVDAAREQSSHRLTTTWAVVERPVVHVHPDEFVGFTTIQAARVLHRMIERLSTMLEAVRYAGA